MPTITVTQGFMDEMRAIAIANPPAEPANPNPPPVVDNAVVNPQMAAYVQAHPGAAFMMMVNKVVPPGYDGTVTVRSGRVLSNPHQEAGEILREYFRRVSAQAGADITAADHFVANAGGLNAYGTDQSAWPSMVDEYAVRMRGAADPYLPGTNTPPPPASSSGRFNWGALTDVDREYAIATFVRRAGANVPALVAEAFGSGVDWSNFKEANEFAIGNFDTAAYERDGGVLAGKL